MFTGVFLKRVPEFFRLDDRDNHQAEHLLMVARFVLCFTLPAGFKGNDKAHQVFCAGSNEFGTSIYMFFSRQPTPFVSL